MQALDEMDRLRAADPVTTAPEVPDFERVVMARVADAGHDDGRRAAPGRPRRRWARRVAVVAVLGVGIAVAVPTLLIHSDEGSVDVLAKGAQAVAAQDGQTLRLAYDITTTANGQDTYREHQELTSNPASGRWMAVGTIGDRRNEVVWDGTALQRWTNARPDVIRKTAGDAASSRDAAPDGQVGMLRWMYDTHRLAVTEERDVNGEKQWVLTGTPATGVTMTVILNADTFVPQEIRRAYTDASGTPTVQTTTYGTFTQTNDPVPDSLPGHAGVPVITSPAGG